MRKGEKRRGVRSRLGRVVSGASSRAPTSKVCRDGGGGGGGRGGGGAAGAVAGAAFLIRLKSLAMRSLAMRRLAMRRLAFTLKKDHVEQAVL